MAKGVYICGDNFTKRNLPDGYIQLESIAFTGTQYFDLGFKPNQDTRVVVDIDVTARTEQCCLFGARTAYQNTCFGVFTENNNNGYQVDYGNNATITTGVNSSGRHTLDFSKNAFSVDGIIHHTNTYTSFSCSYNLFLLSYNNAGSAMTAYPVSGKLYSAQAYSNGTLIRDLVPCKNPDGVVGMYDLAGNEFYANSGSGTFAEGAAYKNGVARKGKKISIGVVRKLPEGYTQLTHIQSSGTQYIDTGFAPNQNARVVLDFEAMGIGSSAIGLFGARTAKVTNSFAVFTSTTKTAWQDDYGTAQIIDNAVFPYLSGRMVYDKNKNVTTLRYSDGSEKTYMHDEQTFATPYNLVLLSVNTAGTIFSGKISTKLYSCKIYDNGALVRDFVPCINLSGAVGLFDVLNNRFYANAGTGSFLAGEPVAADPVSVARRGKRGYASIGGIARLFWGPDKLAYCGTAASLSQGRGELKATTVGDYALFGGGAITGATSAVVDAYSGSLTRSTPAPLSNGKTALAATTVGGYALFGGGDAGGNCSKVDAYNTYLTRSSTSGLSRGRGYFAATTVGGYALFGGGRYSGIYSEVDAFNESLTRSEPSPLRIARDNLAAAAVGGYALFAGGMSGSGLETTVDAYNTSLTRSTPASLSIARRYAGATCVGDYALFAGGTTGKDSSVVDAYNTYLTRSTPTALSAARCLMGATTIGGHALFGGGSGVSAVVDVYDRNLTRSVATSLSGARDALAATNVGDYALFAGGRNSYGAVVDVYALI